MLLASKYEEIYPPEIRDLVFITDRAYNKEQILEMESTMANALEFRLTVPTIYCFLLRYLKVRTHGLRNERSLFERVALAPLVPSSSRGIDNPWKRAFGGCFTVEGYLVLRVHDPSHAIDVLDRVMYYSNASRTTVLMSSDTDLP